MLQRKTLIILAIFAIVIIGLAIALLLAGDGFFNPAEVKENQNVNEAAEQTQTTASPAIQPVSKLSSGEQPMATVARNFAERFASFSTDANYSNLAEVKLLATARLKAELGKMTAKPASDSYYGVSSKVLKLTVDEFKENAAQVTITLQRQETKTGQPSSVRYQDLNLTLIKLGESWLVDRYNWSS